MIRQFNLDLSSRPSFAVEDYLVARSNAAAVGWLDRWPAWPAPCLVIHGPQGSGKTHLAHLFAARNGAPIVSGALLSASDPPVLAGHGAVAVDDADRSDPETLLHLYNVMAERAGYLLLLGPAPPSRWSIRLADLRSRLLAAPTVGIDLPDDELMAALLVKLFADRQVRVEDTVVQYLVRHIERSFEAVRSTVATLDAAALSRQRPISIALVREALDEERLVESSESAAAVDQESATPADKSSGVT